MRIKISLLVLFLVVLCGCGGSNDSYSIDGGLKISPSYTTLFPGESCSFSVSGTSSPYTAVDSLHLKWSSSGGSFGFKNGLTIYFYAGYEPGTYSVFASDGKHSGSETVDIR